MQDKRPLLVCHIAICMALIVISLGAWTRLNDAGLGCPDWPGCYGQVIVPLSSEQITLAEAEYAGRPVDVHKGMLEMVHRYLASSLGLVVMVLAWFAWRYRSYSGYPVKLSMGLLGLVVVQGLFGMWTVTLKLLPLVVTLHLLGGLLTLLVLVGLRQRLRNIGVRLAGAKARFKGLFPVVLLLLFVQLGLGGWTSANYAGWSCSHWLQCDAQSEIELDYRAGFKLMPEIGPDYQGGMLDQPARAAIQMVHRAGAVMVGLVIGILAFALSKRAYCRFAALTVLGTLVLQVGLGILNVVFVLPLELAMAHHLGAVALLISVLWLKAQYEVGMEGERDG